MCRLHQELWQTITIVHERGASEWFMRHSRLSMKLKLLYLRCLSYVKILTDFNLMQTILDKMCSWLLKVSLYSASFTHTSPPKYEGLGHVTLLFLNYFFLQYCNMLFFVMTWSPIILLTNLKIVLPLCDGWQCERDRKQDQRRGSIYLSIYLYDIDSIVLCYGFWVDPTGLYLWNVCTCVALSFMQEG